MRLTINDVKDKTPYECFKLHKQTSVDVLNKQILDFIDKGNKIIYIEYGNPCMKHHKIIAHVEYVNKENEIHTKMFMPFTN